MKATIKLLLLSLFTFIASVSWAQIPNPGFETWSATGFPAYQNPSGWGNLNGSTWLGGIGALTCERGSGGDVHSGTYSMKLTSKSILGLGDAPGITVTGTINTSTQAFEGGFAYNQRPDYLTGWFKYAPATGDTGEITIWLWKRNAGVYEEVGQGQFRPTGATSTFTQFMIPITYSTAGTPDSARIAMISTNTDNIKLGSTLIVDDLQFISCAGFSVATVATDESSQGAGNGTVDATISGGTPTYSYLWSNGATTEDISGLTSDNYCVTVMDANGCTASSCALVSSPSCNGFSVEVIPTEISIVGGNDGSVSASITGGVPPYSYSWNTNDTINLSAGNYCVTVTDDIGCIATACADVVEPDCSGLFVSTNSTDASSGTANDGAISATADGGVAPYTYSWSNFVNDSAVANVPAGTYTVTVADSRGCTATDVVAVGPDCSGFLVTVTATDATGGVANGTASATVSGGTAPFTYLWSTAAIDQTLTDLPPGNYCVTATDANGCEVISCDSVGGFVGIAALEDAGINIFPNPAQHVVTVELKNQESFNFSMYDAAGKLVLTQVLSSNNNTISIREFPSGNYLVELQQAATGKVFSGKLRKE